MKDKMASPKVLPIHSCFYIRLRRFGKLCEFYPSRQERASALRHPNPPSNVLCSSDYRVQRSDVGSLSTVGPACGCGFDQNDRGYINPQPSGGGSLSLQPSSPHRSPSAVFQAHLNPVILVKNRNPPAIHNSFILIKPTLLSLHGSESTTHRQSLLH
jgi:hypothetical protein